jgi:hypothetical protein
MTGGSGQDSNLRLWDLNNVECNLRHAVRCNAPITSVCWKLTCPNAVSFEEEVVSTHEDGAIKLW